MEAQQAPGVEPVSESPSAPSSNGRSMWSIGALIVGVILLVIAFIFMSDDSENMRMLVGVVGVLLAAGGGYFAYLRPNGKKMI